jgi:hypothetical protein
MLERMVEHDDVPQARDLVDRSLQDRESSRVLHVRVQIGIDAKQPPETHLM